MPHAGLMNERSMGPEEGPLFRAKLHIRGGRRRLRQGKFSAAVVTLSDALNGALEWYVASPERRGMLSIEHGDNLNEDRSIYNLLVRSKVLDGRFDFDAFDRLVERALHEELRWLDYGETLKGIESVMLQLGVMPFDEAALPPEDPATY
ncbi:MAG TPA: hypothetical protein VK448_08535 [Dissulfurispiraceae bacterium]|nr:hypothetical protein [Dissulfurispiraceae bacterium]